jgi:alkylation response protein AidB-like acyl-CoA dehydrogenase
MSDAEFLSALRDSACDVLADHCASHQLHGFVDGEGEAFDRKLWKMAADLGWLGLAAPERCGGLGAGIVETAALQRELGRFAAPIPYISTVLVERALAHWRPSSIADAFCSALCAGEKVAGAGQIGSGRDGGLRAERVDGKFRIEGTCALVLDGTGADLFLLSVRVPGEAAGLALLQASDGLKVEPLPVADRTRAVARLVCNDVVAPAETVLLGSPAAELTTMLADDARILIASDALGGAEAIFDKTVDYLKTRIQFGKPIGSFQALKHRCADHKVRIEAAKFLVDRAAAASQDERSLWAGLAKFNACDAYAAIAGDSVQLHGGIGFTWEHDAHLFLKRAKLNQHLFGDSAEEQDRAARLLSAMECV